jgi:hypothetical protein
MMTNLLKSFRFEKNEKKFSVDYIFSNETAGTGLRLVMNVSVNEDKKTKHSVNKPTATLYQSNELIEKMITEEVLSFTN